MAKERKVYQELSARIKARQNCIDSGNTEWEPKHLAIMEDIQNDFLPSGSGFDRGSIVNTRHSDKLVIETAYHVMDDNGMYDGWIDAVVTVKPSLIYGIEISVRGTFGRRQDIKEYIAETLEEHLTATIIWDDGTKRYVYP